MDRHTVFAGLRGSAGIQIHSHDFTTTGFQVDEQVAVPAARLDDTARAVCDDLETVGPAAAPYDRMTVRFATSLEVDRAGVEAALLAASRVLR